MEDWLWRARAFAVQSEELNSESIGSILSQFQESFEATDRTSRFGWVFPLQAWAELAAFHGYIELSERFLEGSAKLLQRNGTGKRKLWDRQREAENFGKSRLRDITRLHWCIDKIDIESIAGLG